MKMQESGEDYLEMILMLSKKQGYVRSIDVARGLGFSKPSVSRAIHLLERNGYIRIDGDGTLLLTDFGRETAERIYDRHQTLTNYLIQLGVPAETAAQDACRMEHVISQESFECIKKQVLPKTED